MYSESEIELLFSPRGGGAESSSEQRRQPRRAGVAGKRKREEPAVLPPPVDGFAVPAALASSVPGVRIEPMGQLLREYPHLSMDTACVHARAKLAARDRKSTRLNSSHS